MSLENQRQFVHQRDVQVALRIFDDFGGLRDADAGGLMCARRDDRAIQAVDEVGCGGRRTGRHFRDGRQAMELVAGIDAFRAVSGEKIHVELQA